MISTVATNGEWEMLEGVAVILAGAPHVMLLALKTYDDQINAIDS
jgi:hypothetical protein